MAAGYVTKRRHRAAVLPAWRESWRRRRRSPGRGIGSCIFWSCCLSTFALSSNPGVGPGGARPGAGLLLPPALWTGVILLCVLPSTVQSSIAFTSIARGNVVGGLVFGDRRRTSSAWC